VAILVTIDPRRTWRPLTPGFSCSSYKVVIVRELSELRILVTLPISLIYSLKESPLALGLTGIGSQGIPKMMAAVIHSHEMREATYDAVFDFLLGSQRLW
jgi:hypothetical protein